MGRTDRANIGKKTKFFSRKKLLFDDNSNSPSIKLLSSISISSIEKIEIIKSSGSVAYGDGATGGVINIVTNGRSVNIC